MGRILTVTLNPAIDITTTVAELIPGRKLRCAAPLIHPGGGGVNVSRVIKELGGETTALVAIGGATGELMRALLDETGIETVFVETAGMTRQCFAVHDDADGSQYRFVLPGAEQDDGFSARALSAVRERLATNSYPYVVASGSLPPGVPAAFYGDLAEVVRDAGSRLILDTSGPGLVAALDRGVFLARTNRIEARELAEMMDVDPDNPEGLARLILDRGAAEIVILTLGGNGALLVSAGGALQIKAPDVGVLSPVGAGDSYIGALSYALAEEWPIERACSYGVAAASAALMTEATELAYKEDIDRLCALVEELAHRAD